MNKLHLTCGSGRAKLRIGLLLGAILIVIATGSILAFGPAARPSASPQLGFHIERGDVTHLEAARAAGGSFVVLVFAWDTIEPEPNRLYWEVPDAAVRAADFYGLQVVARLDRPPAWARSADGPIPWQLNAYETFVARVAARYGDRLAGVIIWNEPNLSLEWAGRPPDPAGYTQLLGRAYRAVKSAAPELPVLLAGLALTTSTDEAAMNDLDFLQAVYDAGGGEAFDILAAHPYGFGRPPAEPPSPEALNFRRLELQRALMVQNGDAAKPIWVTEMGWRTAAPDPADAWQVVSAQEQAAYTLAALDYAAENYPWLDRLAFWELNARGDDYGYAFWHGSADISPAYEALVDTCARHSPLCHDDPSQPGSASPEQVATFSAQSFKPAPLQPAIPILAPDVIIRLGDRGTLHPHWVHLHRGGERFSPDWQGDFFLTAAQAERDYELLMDVMQIDQPTNRVRINGVELAQLRPRTRPDPTSTWASQRLSVPAEALQPGRNVLEIIAGQRNPARQYSFWRWENFQFRHPRLVAPDALVTDPLLTGWQRRAAPGGWGETNRLRRGPAEEIWLTTNRAGQLWRGQQQPDGPTRFENQAANRPDLLFTDVLPLGQGQLAASQHGLLWRTGEAWQVVTSAPATYAYVVSEPAGRYLAGFEDEGLWSASQPGGPWRPAGLAELTVLDLAAHRNALYAATSDGVYVQPQPGAEWARLPHLPGEREAGSLKRFITRLYTGRPGELVVRNLDQLWHYRGEPTGWQAFGPPELHSARKLLTVSGCCEPGALVGTSLAGVWQLQASGDWHHLEAEGGATTDATEILGVNETLYAAGLLGLLESEDGGRTWHNVEGLSSVVTDLLFDPADPRRWLAGTASGFYRSEDGGQSWQAAGEVRSIWDLAFGPAGRLFAASSQGVLYTDDLDSDPVPWQKARGLGQALFFKVSPHPVDSSLVLAGSWGNDLALSRDGGERLESIGNGLETLSILDVLWHPQAGQLTIATIEGLFRSDNGGASWFKLPGPLTQQTVHSLYQTEAGPIWAGAADGLWASADYGVTWQRVELLPVATVLRLGEISVEGQAWLWAGTEEYGLWLSLDGGSSWRFGGLDGLSVYQLLVDPTRPRTLVAATSEGLYEVNYPR